MAKVAWLDGSGRKPSTMHVRRLKKYGGRTSGVSNGGSPDKIAEAEGYIVDARTVEEDKGEKLEGRSGGSGEGGEHACEPGHGRAGVRGEVGRLHGCGELVAAVVTAGKL